MTHIKDGKIFRERASYNMMFIHSQITTNQIIDYRQKNMSFQWVDLMSPCMTKCPMLRWEQWWQEKWTPSDSKGLHWEAQSVLGKKGSPEFNCEEIIRQLQNVDHQTHNWPVLCKQVNVCHQRHLWKGEMFVVPKD